MRAKEARANPIHVEDPGVFEGYYRASRATPACAVKAPTARVDEVFPLLCPHCGGESRVIAFLADAGRDILSHRGESTSPPRLMRARAPLLWEMPGANTGEDDPQAPSAPEYELERRRAQGPERDGMQTTYQGLAGRNAR
jgi:hypothetical protein